MGDAGVPDLHQAALPQADRRTAIAELQTHYLRKKGQTEIDIRTGRQTEGQFESLVRFELTLAKSFSR